MLVEKSKCKHVSHALRVIPVYKEEYDVPKIYINMKHEQRIQTYLSKNTRE